MHNSSALILSVSILLTMVLSACGAAVPGGACTEEARVSVNVIVKDAMGDPVSDARVDYILDGELSECDNFGDGSYGCGYEQSGEFSITAVKGTMEAGEKVTVTQGRCHVDSEVVELTLMPGSF